MAVTIPAGGSGARITDGSEQALFDVTASGTYTLSVDLKNLAGGDTVVLRAYIAWTAGGARSAMILGGAPSTFTGVQVAPNILLKGIPLIAPYGIKFTIQRTGGVDRSYDWRVDQIGTVTVLQSGTQSTTNAEATIGVPVTTAQVIALLCDMSLQGVSASVTLRAKESVLLAGTVQEAYNFTTAVGVLAAPNQFLQSVPIDAAYTGSFTQIRTGGADFLVPFLVVALAA